MPRTIGDRTGHSAQRLDNLTSAEIEDWVRQDSLALLPTGCTERYAPHLPAGFDGCFAHMLALAAARTAAQRYGVRSLVALPILYGAPPKPEVWRPGHAESPVEPHSALISRALESLAEQGFRRIVVWRGCEGCDLVGVVDDFNRRVGPGVRAFLPDQPYQEVWRRVGEPGLAGEYGDRYITTLAMYLWSDAVRADQRCGDEPVAVTAGRDPKASLEAVRARPIPDAGSIELGAQLWFATTELVTLTLKIAAETPLDVEEGRWER